MLQLLETVDADDGCGDQPQHQEPQRAVEPVDDVVGG
jgi:hypothetical protein